MKYYVLQIVIKVTNNITRLDSFILTLFIFSIFPKISLINILLTTTIKRGRVIRKVIKEVVELYIKRYINKAL